MIIIFEPILNLRESYPEEFEEAQRATQLEIGGVIEINKLLFF